MSPIVRYLEHSAAVESAVGGIYACLAARLPEAGQFWSTLEAEESGHAQRIRMLIPIVAAKPDLVRLRPAGAAAFDRMDALLDTARRIAESDPVLTQHRALSLAISIEGSLLEQDPLRALESADFLPEFVHDSIRDETHSHFGKLLHALGRQDRTVTDR
jgi:hypothetical protein